MIRVRYFARLREQLGTSGEELPWDPEIANLGALAAHLRRRGGVWEEAFDGRQTLLMAVNQEMANGQTQIGDGDEAAFFPPVTGG